jgi:primosomal replication protein N
LIESQLNRCVIEGELVELDDLRYTPAGLARVGMKIRHNSTQQEAGIARQIQCDVPAISLDAVALKASKLLLGQQVRVEGFLAQRSLRNSQLILHIDNIKLK